MLAFVAQAGVLAYAQGVATNSPAPASSAPTPPTVKEAADLYRKGKSDEALSTINAVIQADSTNINAYILRGAIYSQKQAWDQAEKDYQTALQMQPKDTGIQFDLADLKFKQKQFDAAREAFVPLQDDRDVEVKDLIAYKIFLCDLLSGHDDAAKQELDVFNQVGSDPSYYFGNAAWSLVHKNPEEARGYLVSARHIYAPSRQLLYATILKDMGYLPLPQSAGAK